MKKPVYPVIVRDKKEWEGQLLSWTFQNENQLFMHINWEQGNGFQPWKGHSYTFTDAKGEDLDPEYIMSIRKRGIKPGVKHNLWTGKTR